MPFAVLSAATALAQVPLSVERKDHWPVPARRLIGFGLASVIIDGMDDPTLHDEPTAASSARGRKRSTAGGLIAAVRETVLVIAVALVVSLVVKTFLLQAFFIPSQSMEQTLDIGDRVIVSKLTPGPFDLHRGDVIVFSDPGGWLTETAPPQRGPVGAAVAKSLTFVGLLPESSNDHLIKRVIGLPGDHITSDGQGPVVVNGIPIDESDYLSAGVQPSQDQPFDVTVPAGRLWVMGDNRPNSCDSRCNTDKPSAGFVPLNLVTGRAYAVVWPLSHWTWLGTPEAFNSVRDTSGVS